MRRKGQVAFSHHFSYRLKGGGFIDSLMKELDDGNKLISPTHIPLELINRLRVLKPSQNHGTTGNAGGKHGGMASKMNPFLAASISSDIPLWQQQLTKSEGESILLTQDYSHDNKNNGFFGSNVGIVNQRGNGGKGDATSSTSTSQSSTSTSNPFLLKNQLLSNKERHEAMIQLENMKLSKLLLETEGFSMQGDFYMYQGDTQVRLCNNSLSLSIRSLISLSLDSLYL